MPTFPRLIKQRIVTQVAEEVFVRRKFMTEAAHKSWKTRRARRSTAAIEKNASHAKLSKAAVREVSERKRIQALVAPYLVKWWKRELLCGSRSGTKPRKCEVCGESEKLGLAIHHIDPSISKSNENYNSMENKAPLCGTCHNIISYKKTSDPNDIVNALKSRHDSALRNGLLES